MLKLYQNIKARRIQLGLTQTELAIKAGYSDKSMIAKIEKGDVDLPQSKIMLFANALNIPAPTLMGWDDEKEYVLTTAEQALVNSFRHLNNEGQEKAVEYVGDLVATGRYDPDDVAFQEEQHRCMLEKDIQMCREKYGEKGGLSQEA